MRDAQTWAVECYLPGIDQRTVERAGGRAAVAAEQLGSSAEPVEYVGALLVPGDEVVFHLFTAGSADPVREASTRAGIEFERVLESVPVGIDALEVPWSGGRNDHAGKGEPLR